MTPRVFEAHAATLHPSMQISCSGTGYVQHGGILKPLGDSWKFGSCRGKDSNSGPREHHSRALTTQPRLALLGVHINDIPVSVERMMNKFGEKNRRLLFAY